MSDYPRGEGWWQASDDKWYAPELHPDHVPEHPPSQAPDRSPTPGITDFDPPRFDQRVGPLPTGPPGEEVGPGSFPGPAPAQRYPTVEPRRSTGKILAIVFGVLFLLMAGGCGAILYVFRDQIADATIDFSDGVPVDNEVSCEVVGLEFGTNYDIEATLSATDSTMESHYRLDFEVVSADGRQLGADQTVFRNMQPGERRTEDVFGTIAGSDPYETTSCRVVELLRVPA